MSPATAQFNVLLTEDRPHAPEHWTRQLPRLLSPMGVAAHLAHTAREALDLADQLTIHAAVIDLGTPHEDTPNRATAGMWLVELFRRMPASPPVIIINSPALSQRQVDRLLHDALRREVFSVLNKPVELEQVLGVFRRLLDRRHDGQWPALSN